MKTSKPTTGTPLTGATQAIEEAARHIAVALSTAVATEDIASLASAANHLCDAQRSIGHIKADQS